MTNTIEHHEQVLDVFRRWGYLAAKLDPGPGEFAAVRR